MVPQETQEFHMSVRCTDTHLPRSHWSASKHHVFDPQTLARRAVREPEAGVPVSHGKVFGRGQALEARRKAPRLRPAQLPTKPQAPRLTLSPCRAGPSGLAHGPVFFDARAAPCGFDTGGRRHEPSVRTIGCTFLPAAGHSG